MTRTIDLYSVELTVHAGVITTRYPDGASCLFAPPLAEDGSIDAGFLAAMQEMGYTDPFQYALEHELGHHIVAFGRGLPHSSIVWDAAHHVAMSMEEPDRAAEEHLVNRLQRYMNLGAADPYGCLQQTFGENLPGVAKNLLHVSRPWLYNVAAEETTWQTAPK